MHSRIYQISEKPIPAEERTSEFRYEGDFVGSIADYVAGEEFRSNEYIQDLKWLESANKGIKVNTEENTITITSKEEYFKEKHEVFLNALKELQDISLEEFISDKKHFTLYNLKCAYEEKYGFYVDDNDDYYGITPLDNFVRNAEENKVYYIGTITDYHF